MSKKSEISKELKIPSEEKKPFKVIERSKNKRKSKLLQNVEEEPVKISQKEVRKLQKKIKFSFAYERDGFTKDMTRNFRGSLSSIINKRYKNELVKKIPDEFTLELRLTAKSKRPGQKYLVYLANKEELLVVDPDMKFDPKKFEWCKGLEEQEWGMIGDAF
jgi:hypothetical protein